MSNNRAPSYEELTAMNNSINGYLTMHKFATSHDERAMLQKSNPRLYEERKQLIDRYGAQAWTLPQQKVDAFKAQRKANTLAQIDIASAEGKSAERWANFWEGAEKTALVTRNVATGALVVVGTVATGGALLAPLAGGTVLGASTATLATVGTVAFTGVTVANLSGKIASGKQLDGGDYAELLLTVLPFGAGKAGLLLKETMGAVRAAKALKLIEEAQKIAKAEKTPVGKALEKLLQTTAKGREAAQDFVTACRNRVINPASGLGKILDESKVLRQAQQEANRLQKAMRQNMKDQQRLQEITDQLGRLKAKNPGIAGNIDPALMKEVQKRGIKITNAWTAADGRVMSAGQNLSGSLKTAAGNTRTAVGNGLKAMGKALKSTGSALGAASRTPLARGALVVAGLGAAYGFGARGSQAVPENMESGYFQQQRPPLNAGNQGTTASSTEAPTAPPQPQIFNVTPEFQAYETQINTQLQQLAAQNPAGASVVSVVTNTAVPQQTSYDAATKTLHAADLTKLSDHWQQVSLTFREQLIGKSPEVIMYMTGAGKGDVVNFIRSAIADGTDKAEMSAKIDNMLAEKGLQVAKTEVPPQNGAEADRRAAELLGKKQTFNGSASENAPLNSNGLANPPSSGTFQPPVNTIPNVGSGGVTPPPQQNTTPPGMWV